MNASGADGYPSGGAMRRWTRLVHGSRRSTSVGELLSDAYTVLLTLAVAVAMVGALARSQGLLRAAAPPSAGLDTGWISVLLAVAVLGAGTGILARTGPVSLGAARAAWWLPLPGERGSLLRPSLLVPTGVSGGVGAVTGLLLALALDPALTLAHAVAAALAGLGLGAAVALALVPLEASGRRRAASLGGDLLLALVPVAALVLALAPPGPVAVSGAWWPVGAALGLAALAALAALRALPRVHDTELRERGAATVELQGASLTMDTRALGRALDTEPTRGRRRSARLRGVPRLVRLLGPGVVVAVADARLLLRSPRRVVQLGCGAALALLAPFAPSLPALVTALLVVAGAWLGALTTAQGARDAHAVPAVDALLPVSQRTVRLWRLAVPVLAMLVWTVPVFAVLGHAYADLTGWLALGLLAAPVWAGGAVRSAYRPEADFSGPLIVTPMGAYPPGMATIANTGPDVVLLGAVPLLVAVLVGAVTPVLLVLQVALTALAVVLAVRPARRREHR